MLPELRLATDLWTHRLLRWTPLWVMGAGWRSEKLDGVAGEVYGIVSGAVRAVGRQVKLRISTRRQRWAAMLTSSNSLICATLVAL